MHKGWRVVIDEIRSRFGLQVCAGEQRLVRSHCLGPKQAKDRTFRMGDVVVLQVGDDRIDQCPRCTQPLLNRMMLSKIMICVIHTKHTTAQRDDLINLNSIRKAHSNQRDHTDKRPHNEAGGDPEVQVQRVHGVNYHGFRIYKSSFDHTGTYPRVFLLS